MNYHHDHKFSGTNKKPESLLAKRDLAEERSIMINNEKPKIGRPKKDYFESFAQEAEELCAEKGYTDKQLAKHFKIGKDTLYRWKREFPEFAESIKRGKNEFDSRVVENSLLKRASGFKEDDVHISCHKGEVIKTPIKKYYPPDVTACIFWLKNRNPQRWRDHQEAAVQINTEKLTIEDVKQAIKASEEAGDGLCFG